MTTFEELREQLETAGYVVECAGDAECAEGELLRVRSIAVPHALSASLSSDALRGTPLAGLVEGGLFSGEISIGGQLTVDRGFGVDAEGFFVTADSLITTPLTIEANVSGDVGIFGLGIAAEIRLIPEFRLAQLDTNGDGKLRGSEFDNLLAGVSLTIGPIEADLTFDAVLGFLDYIDVDPNKPNRPHGGDPFIVRGAATLSAQPSQFDADNFAGVDLRWTNVRALNPDVDGDGNLDYTPAVFLKNVLHLGDDLLSGEGILDYFSGVLGIDGAAAADGAASAEPNELPGGKLPEVLPILADERAAVDGIDEALRAVIIVSEGPPTVGELIAAQKRELRGWFLADPDDDVSLEAEQSVQFRLAKIAPVLPQGYLPAGLVELVSPIENDAEFDRLLVEALTDWIRWRFGRRFSPMKPRFSPATRAERTAPCCACGRLSRSTASAGSC